MKLLYAFPEPLPLPRARGLQVVQTVRALAGEHMDVELCYVPDKGDPFGACGPGTPTFTAAGCGLNMLMHSRSARTSASLTRAE